VEGFTALLIDGTDFQAAESEMIRQLAQRYPKTRSIALMDFPRIEDRHHLESETILLLSKPINVEDLFEKISQENRKQLPHELIREH
jgi:hypothetical protein